MFRRLTTRLVLSHLLVIAIAMALLSFVLLSLVQGYFLQATQQSLTIQARLTAKALTSSQGLTLTNIMQTILPPASNVLQQQQFNRLAERIPSIEREYSALSDSSVRLNAGLETRIRVVDERGVVQADSQGSDMGRDLSGDPTIATALRGQERAQTQGDRMTVAVPLRKEGRIVGAVSLSQPLNDVTAVLADLRIRLLLAASVSLVLSALERHACGKE